MPYSYKNIVLSRGDDAMKKIINQELAGSEER